jgi:CRISPR-associated protein Cas2
MRSLFDSVASPERNRAKKLVVEAEDNLRFYWIPIDAVSRVKSIGSPPPELPPNYYII